MDRHFEYPLGGGALVLSGEQAKVMRSLSQSTQWQIFCLMLAGMKQAAEKECASPGSDLDTIRVAQGKISALEEVCTIMEQAISEWWEAGQSNKPEE